MGSSPSTCMRVCCMNAANEHAEDMLPAPPEQPIGHGSSSSRSEGPGRPALVPPLSDWLQALKQNRAQQQETPRFNEVWQSPGAAPGGDPGSPRSVGGEYPTPRETPRPGIEDMSGSRSEEELSYEGPRLGDMKHGVGYLRCKNFTYTGSFDHDCRHGQGTLCWTDGRCYTGQFEQGKFHGVASMTWPDGRIFEGQYIRDRKHGDGAFSWPDGRRYDGQWICGKRHGVGTYTNAKGLTRRGWWQNDRPVQWEPAELRLPLGSSEPAEDAEARTSALSPLKESAEVGSPPKDGGMSMDLRPQGVASEQPVQSTSPCTGAWPGGSPNLVDAAELLPSTRPTPPASPRLRDAAVCSPRPLGSSVTTDAI